MANKFFIYGINTKNRTLRIFEEYGLFGDPNSAHNFLANNPSFTQVTDGFFVDTHDKDKLIGIQLATESLLNYVFPLNWYTVIYDKNNETQASLVKSRTNLEEYRTPDTEEKLLELLDANEIIDVYTEFQVDGEFELN